VVLCALLISMLVYTVIKREQDVVRCMNREHYLYSVIDSINREQIVMFRNMAFKDQVIQEQGRIIGSTDSIMVSLEEASRIILRAREK
jgi:hypothetical protein